MAGVQLNRSGSDGGHYEGQGRRHSSFLSIPDMQLIKGLNSIKNEDWKNVQSAITKLFQMRKLTELSQDLPGLHERLNKLLETEVGQFISDSYQDHILKKCMIILRHDLRGLKGAELLEKLSEVWTQFFTQILPTLEMILAPTLISVRSVTLLGFRDHVLLKTPVSEALDATERKDVDQRITQMLLVLQVQLDYCVVCI
jgi:hypothetical protein